MLSEVRIRRVVEFSETDMAGIAHFTNYLKWMEAAEAAFFRQLDWPLLDDAVTTVQGWPRVRVSATYAAPVRFGDTVEVWLRLREIRASALGWEAIFYRLPAAGEPPEVARAEMTTLHATLDRSTGVLKGCLIPEALRARLTIA